MGRHIRQLRRHHRPLCQQVTRCGRPMLSFKTTASFSSSPSRCATVGVWPISFAWHTSARTRLILVLWRGGSLAGAVGEVLVDAAIGKGRQCASVGDAHYFSTWTRPLRALLGAALR
jgi:hypothetical protein